MAKSEEYSIEQLNALIKSIMERYSLNENEIEQKVNRSYGYISQTRSRGKVPTAFYKLLQNAFQNAMQNNGGNGNGPANQHGPPVDEIVKSKDETINALKEHLTFLKSENERLKKECESSLTGLNRYAQIVNARVQALYESHKILRAAIVRPEKKKIDAVAEELDKIYLSILQETFEADTGHK